MSNLAYRLNLDQGRTVVPTGICLTAIVVCLLILTGRVGHEPPMAVAADLADDAEPIWEDLPNPVAPVEAVPKQAGEKAKRPEADPTP